jgi:1-acyl-sn-glycerol-3-phosphate acyltransferase
MLYHIVKPLLRIIIHMFYKKLYVNNITVMQQQKPIMLIANHPNSFFDAFLLGAILNRPVYSLTRGDVFANTLFIAILKSMKLIPIYRLKDGKSNLAKNDNTFDACVEVFNNNGIILIFGEAKCEGQYELLPLQKGGIKIALHAWQTNGLAASTVIIPVAINYSQLTGWRKVGTVVFGNPMQPPVNVHEVNRYPFLINDIRKQLYQFYDGAIIQKKHITNVDKQHWQQCFEEHSTQPNATLFIEHVNAQQQKPLNIKSKRTDVVKLVLTMLYFPFFSVLRKLCHILNRIGKVHYDSFMVCGIVLLYPLYLIMVYAGLILFLPTLISLSIISIYAMLPLMAYRKIIFSK